MIKKGNTLTTISVLATLSTGVPAVADTLVQPQISNDYTQANTGQTSTGLNATSPLQNTSTNSTVPATSGTTSSTAGTQATQQQNTPATTSATNQQTQSTTSNQPLQNTATQAQPTTSPQTSSTTQTTTSQATTSLLTCYQYHLVNGELQYTSNVRYQCLTGETSATPLEMLNNPVAMSSLPTTAFTAEDIQTSSSIVDSTSSSTTVDTEEIENATKDGKLLEDKVGKGDDYPFKVSGCENAVSGTLIAESSPLGTWVCQCTDFVLWRLNQAAGGDEDNIKFKNTNSELYAYDFPKAYKNYEQDTSPRVGDVAVKLANSKGAGEMGHVAYVVKVDKTEKTVTVEQYNTPTESNNNTGLSYSEDEYSIDDFDTYIHFGKKADGEEETDSSDSDSSTSTDTSTSDSSDSSSAPVTESGSVWDTLAQCESSGDWSINTGNGFYGGLQFTAETWSEFGGEKYAASAEQATRDEQIDIAKKVQAAQGWNAWPACSAKLALS
ncbi:MAG: transglycosylase family protein [Micrococcaceae bacterium]